ncbi:hypothetical protein ACRRTK_010004 [Alexandromys fortis]
MDLGECLKVHDLALRADYEIASKEQDFFFELDAMDHLQSFIADCDRRTEVSKKRLAETQEEISAEVAAKAERVHELNEEIGKLLAKVEQLGAEGNVEESQKVMDEVEKARAKKREAEEVYRNSRPASGFQQQKLRVCEVCSAYLGLHDNDRRLADHFGGKLHLGFIEIREKLEELKRVVAEKQENRNQERLKRREEGEREEWEKLRRSRSREHRRHRSRSMSRDARGGLDPSLERNDIATGPVPVAAAAATREVGTVLEIGAESDPRGVLVSAITPQHISRQADAKNRHGCHPVLISPTRASYHILISNEDAWPTSPEFIFHGKEKRILFIQTSTLEQSEHEAVFSHLSFAEKFQTHLTTL